MHKNTNIKLCKFLVDIYAIRVYNQKQRCTRNAYRGGDKMQTLYPNIEAERARMNLSQEELSNKLGIERKSYYNWLTKGNIPIPMLINLAELFNCSTDYLLGRTRTP